MMNYELGSLISEILQMFFIGWLLADKWLDAPRIKRQKEKIDLLEASLEGLEQKYKAVLGIREMLREL